MVRIALARFYGQKTGSIYEEEKTSEVFRESVNAVAEPTNGIFYKTHEQAARRETVPCVVVVRDPRCVFPSLQRFYCEKNELEYSMEDLIYGRHPWGDWSEWVQSWVRYAPPDALWLRYEDFKPSTIGRWFGFKINPEAEMPDLAALRERDSTLFGEGKTEPESSEYDRLILSRHGSMMSMLGYER